MNELLRQKGRATGPASPIRASLSVSSRFGFSAPSRLLAVRAPGQHTVDHRWGGAEIIRGLGQGTQLLRAEWVGDGRDLEQYVEQRPVGLDRDPAGVIDEIVCLVA